MDPSTLRNSVKGSALERLSSMSASPFEVQPPKRSLRVDAIIWLTHRRRARRVATPHLSGGSDESKTEWEYASGHTFFEALRGYCDISLFDGKDVLDAGCGWGGKAVWFAENSGLRSISGFDLPGVFRTEVAERFADAKSMTNCSFTNGYAEKMPYGDCSFDVVLMEDVLEHVSDPEKTIAECFRVLRPGGKVLIKFPSYRMLTAHHLDRALSLPGLHYLISMRTWAAGLNYRLLRESTPSYEPFDRTVKTAYTRCTTENLNGLDIAAFRKIVRGSGFLVDLLTPVPFRMESSRWRIVRPIYRAIRALPWLTEPLSHFTLFIGTRPGSPVNQ